MAQIILDIKNCTECPHFKRERMYTSDSFEEAYNWFCKKQGGKKIQGYVEWNDKVEVPDWCPIRVTVKPYRQLPSHNCKQVK